MRALILHEKNIFGPFFRFRQYYNYVLSFTFLRPRRPTTATTGLLLASAMTLNMTSKIVVTPNDLQPARQGRPLSRRDGVADASSERSRLPRPLSTRSADSKTEDGAVFRLCAQEIEEHFPCPGSILDFKNPSRLAGSQRSNRSHGESSLSSTNTNLTSMLQDGVSFHYRYGRHRHDLDLSRSSSSSRFGSSKKHRKRLQFD